MEWKTAIRRAARAMREDARLHLVAVSSLTVAFLALAAALFGIANLASVADAWGERGRLTIYLRDGAEDEAVDQLRLLLEGLPEVRAAEHRTSREARAIFLDQAEVDAALTDLPAEAFPASLEVELAARTSPARTAAIAARVSALAAVEDVETYRGFFEPLEVLLASGRVAATALAGLVLLCVLFVVGNTIRLAIAGRRDEIEVLKLCGASDRFVRGPFLVEGAVQGLISALLAVLLLLTAFLALRESIDATIGALAGVRTVFLEPLTSFGLVFGGAAVGAAGSAISLRRYLVA